VEDLLASEVTRVNVKLTISKIWVELACIFCTFMITYMMYPSIVFLKSKDIYPKRKDWSIFIINVGQGLGDFMGRSLAKLKDS
jgi:hypothetical protein